METIMIQGLEITVNSETAEVVNMDWAELGRLFRSGDARLAGMGPGTYGDFRVYLTR